jgi:hypothetical protein
VKPTHETTRLLIAFLVIVVIMPQTALTQNPDRTKEIIPTIRMDNVPLDDAIRNLARQAGINYILDPRLSGGSVGPDGKFVQEPSVTGVWTNVTAEEALDTLLKQHSLAMVSSPATTIARIALTNEPVKPVPASQVAGDTNHVIPLIVMDDVPLADAISNLARQAQLKVTFDTGVETAFADSFRRPMSDSQISVRWTNVTARQALAALLDDFDLLMVQDDPSASAVTITTRKLAGADSAGKPRQK